MTICAKTNQQYWTLYLARGSCLHARVSLNCIWSVGSYSRFDGTLCLADFLKHFRIILDLKVWPQESYKFGKLNLTNWTLCLCNYLRFYIHIHTYIHILIYNGCMETYLAHPKCLGTYFAGKRCLETCNINMQLSWAKIRDIWAPCKLIMWTGVWFGTR